MTAPTREIAAIKSAVEARFPSVVDGGIYNCRRIAGSSTWSQHAHANAWDIFGPGRSDGPADQALLDQVYAYLIRQRGTLPVGTVCWKHHGGCSAAAHQDHIHVEGPKRRGTPVCAGGDPLEDDDDRDVPAWARAASSAAVGAARVRDAAEPLRDQARAAQLAVGALTNVMDRDTWVRLGFGALGVAAGVVGLVLLRADLVGQVTGLSPADVGTAIASRGASAAA